MNKKLFEILLTLGGFFFSFVFFLAFGLSFSGTCTSGSTDAFTTGAIYSPIMAIFATLFFAFSTTTPKPFAYFRIIIPIVSIVVVGMAWEHMFSTVCNGNHLCGEEFNDSLLGDINGPIFYSIFLGSLISINVSGLWPIFISKKANTP